MHMRGKDAVRRRSVDISNAERGYANAESFGMQQRGRGATGRKSSFKTPRDGRRRSSNPTKDDTYETVLYEGPSGPKSTTKFHRTTVIITDWSVEIEREGANAFCTLLTCGLWFYLFQSISTELFELEDVTEIALVDDIIVGSYRPRCSCCKRKSTFRIDIPPDAGTKVEDLFRELKHAWTDARMDIAAAEQRELEFEAQSLLGCSVEEEEWGVPVGAGIDHYKDAPQYKADLELIGLRNEIGQAFTAV